MNLIALGLDLVETERVKQVWESHGERFLKRVLLPEEIEYCLGVASPEIHIAARWAAKEAISKCFRTGITKAFGWHDARIAREPEGAPYVILSEKALALARSMGGNHILVTLTHTRHYAAAQAALVASDEIPDSPAP
jgi:holo-[acyl-carrier protein] synthase